MHFETIYQSFSFTLSGPHTTTSYAIALFLDGDVFHALYNARSTISLGGISFTIILYVFSFFSNKSNVFHLHITLSLITNISNSVLLKVFIACLGLSTIGSLQLKLVFNNIGMPVIL